MFAKAKRFVNKKETTPGAGHYDPLFHPAKNATVVFEKSKRFNQNKNDTTLGPGDYQGDLTFLNPNFCSPFKVLSHSTPNLANLSAGKKEKQKKDDGKEPDHAAPLLNLEDFLGGEDEAKKAREELERQLCTATENLESAQDVCRTLQAYKDQLVSKNKNLSVSLKDLRVENITHADFIRHLKGELFASQDTAECDRQKLFETSAETAELMEKIQELEETEETLNTNIKALTDKYMALESQYSQLQADHNERVTALTAELDLTKTNLKDQIKDHEGLQNINLQLHNDVLKIQESKDNIAAKLTLSDDQNIVLRAKLDDKAVLIDDLIAKDDDLERVDCELRDIVEELSVEREKLNLCIAEKTARIEELLQLKIKMDEVILEKERIIEEMCGEKEGLRKLVSVKEGFVEGLQEERLKLLKSLEEWQVRMEELECKKECLVKRVEQKEEEVAGLKEEVDVGKRAVEELEGKIVGLNEDVAMEKRAMEEKNGEVMNLKEEVEKERKLADDKQKICDDLTSEMTNYKKTLEENVEIVNNLEIEALDFRDVVKAKESELMIVNTEKDLLMSRVNENEVIVGELRQEKEDLVRKIERLAEVEEEKERLVKMVEDKDFAICQLGKEIVDYRSQIDDLTTQLIEQECTIHRVESELREQTTIVNERDARLMQLAQDLATKIACLSTLEIDHENLQKELHARENDFVSKMETQQVNYEEVVAERDYLSDQNIILNHDVLERNAHISDLKKRSDSLTDSLDKLRIDSDFAVGELDDKNSQLRQNLQESQELMDEMSSKLLFVSSDLQETKTKLEGVNVERGELETTITELKENLAHKEAKQTEMLKCNENLGAAVNAKEEELDNLQVKCEELTSSLQNLASQHASLQLDFDSYKSSSIKTEADYQIELERLRLDNAALHTQQKTNETQITQLQEDNSHLTRQNTELHRVTSELTAKVDKMKKVMAEKDDETKELSKSLLDAVTRTKATKMTLDFTQEKLVAAQKVDEGWHAKYDALVKMIEPFKEQLAAFEQEKNSLLSRSNDNKKEMSKLEREYAQLLGHQNNKQKIKHVMKLKEDQSSLRSELTSIREDNDKKQRQIRRLEDKVATLEGRKRFDTSKAFSHSKENVSVVGASLNESKSVSRSTSRPVLRDGNHA